MKIVVYFRQAGGVAARDYPVATHWAEDENEIPAPLFSSFDLERVNAVAAEIVAQIEAVNPWLEARRGVVVATFTEVEDGSSSRPAYGTARKEAARQRAVLLVATSKAITGQTFDPASQDDVEVITLHEREPSGRSRPHVTASTPVVLYLRAGAPGAEADELLKKQREGLSKSNFAEPVLAEFFETEGADPTERPELEKALRLCREGGALLFIGTTDSIGDLEEFRPAFTDVPYEVAYRKAYNWPDLISVSTCPYQVALYFGKQWVSGNIPLYLANPTGTDVAEVQVISRGSALVGGEIIETKTGSKSLGQIPAGQARLLEAYDVYFDGDFLTEYHINAKLADGTRFIGRAIVKDIPAGRWVKVELGQPHPIELPQ